MIACSICSTSKELNRVPRGWHRRADDVLCAKCWAARYVLRAITIPVVRPLGEGIGWPELRKALSESWSLSTAATNWVMTQLFVRDEQRDGQVKMPTMPKIYLYPELRKRFPDLPTQTCAALENALKAKYRAKRYEIIWTCESSLPNARYPQPAISSNQSWKPIYAPAGKDGGDLVPCVQVTLLLGQKYLLQLRGGQEFRRQLAAFKQLVDGGAVKGELAIIRKRIGGDDNRNGAKARDNGGQQFQTRVMVKMAGWFPRQNAVERSGNMILTTTTDAMLVAFDAKNNRLFTIHGDHVKRWCAEHAARLQRWSNDGKMESRRKAVPWQSRRERACLKFNHRMDSAISQMAAQVVGYADRQRFAEIKWIDGEPFVKSFQWSKLQESLKTKADAFGITFSKGVAHVEDSGIIVEPTGSGL